MIKNKILIPLVAVISSFLLCFAAAADEQAEKKAARAAEKWLETVDNGGYSESWDTAAELFKIAVTKEQWAQAVTAVRKPLGKLVSRKLKAQQYATSLPGAPDGDYVVIQYESSFMNKKYAVETITPMLEKDGRWRVSGYYIK